MEWWHHHMSKAPENSWEYTPESQKGRWHLSMIIKMALTVWMPERDFPGISGLQWWFSSENVDTCMGLLGSMTLWYGKITRPGSSEAWCLRVLPLKPTVRVWILALPLTGQAITALLYGSDGEPCENIWLNRSWLCSQLCIINWHLFTLSSHVPGSQHYHFSKGQ